MLYELYVENFALIRSLRLSLQEGMTALTGETGAGKSLIIDAVSLLIGGRGSDSFIRGQEDRCLIEGVFFPPYPDEVQHILADFGPCEETLTLSRELIRGGRSIARINGRLASVSILKEIGRYLINIHGQHDHTLLLEESRQLKMLDLFGGEELQKAANMTAQAYHNLVEAKAAVEDYETHVAERLQRLDYLQYVIHEIEEISPQPEEDTTLEEEAKLLSFGEKLYDLSHAAHQVLFQSGGVVEQLEKAHAFVADGARTDEKLAPLAERLNNLYYEAEDIANEIGAYRDHIDLDAYRLEEVENRIAALTRLKKKYGGSMSALLHQYTQAKEEAKHLEEVNLSGEAYKDALRQAEAAYAKAADFLHVKRQAAAEQLGTAVTAEIQGMQMPNAEFTVALIDHAPSAAGNERAVFMIQPNLGEATQPVSKIASGGELSRILLGIKVILAKLDGVPVLIFDEVDTGLSGRALTAVSQRLALVGESAQTLAISHSAVMAAAADHQIYIEKHEEDGRTVMKAHSLNEAERIQELARLIAGDHCGPTTIKQAEEMLQEMHSRKPKE